MRMGKTRAADGVGLDAFYRGRIKILQRRGGYRFAVDAPLLADFIRTRESDEGLELGIGNGAVSLLLSIKPFRRVTGVEILAGPAELARRNVALNGLEGRVEIVRGDIRRFRPRRKFDLIFSNPPYIGKGTGPLSATAEKAAARHEVHGGIGDFLRKTAEWLKEDGRACFVYPERRRADFMRAADEAGLAARAVRSVQPRREAAANLFLAELGLASAGNGGEGAAGAGTGRAVGGRAVTVTLPPLILFEREGVYTEEADEVFAGRPLSSCWRP
jgi:tRNA1Val (adenine37-N6)-methyltransferase